MPLTLKGAQYCIDSDGFFFLKELPKKVIIVGGGYIATELSSILNLLGSEVELVIRGNSILTNFDPMLVEHLTEICKNNKIKFHFNQEISKVTRNKQKKLTAHCKKNKKITNIDCVIYAIGRHPRTQDLNLKAAGVKLNEKNYVITDKWAASTIPHIYAIGDVAAKNY